MNEKVLFNCDAIYCYFDASAILQSYAQHEAFGGKIQYKVNIQKEPHNSSQS